MKHLLFVIPFLNDLYWYLNYLNEKLKNPSIKFGTRSKIVNSSFGKFNTFGIHVSVVNSNFGNYSYAADFSQFLNVTCGAYCSFGPRVQIGLGVHPVDEFVASHPIFYSTRRQAQISILEENEFEEFKPIIIGNNVWVGSSAIILDGVSIGDGAIVGAGAVVTKNVEPYTIVAGVPAKIIKQRFNQNKIDQILETFNWDETPESLKQKMDQFDL